MAASKAPPDVRQYLDYRAFLDAWFEWKKSTRPRYSQRAFSRRAGVSHTLVSQVCRREKHLSEKTASDFGAAMGLEDDELRHFVLLVERATTSSERLRTELTHRAMGARGMQGAVDLSALSLRYLAAWWIPVVRELACRDDFRADPEWIAARILPRISADQADEALQVLLGLDLLREDDDGRLRPNDAPLVTPPEAEGVAYRGYHASMIDLARGGLESLRADQRFYQTAMLAVPVGMEAQLRVELRNLAERLVGMVEDARSRGGRPMEQVLLLNLHLLPVSTPASKEDAEE